MGEFRVAEPIAIGGPELQDGSYGLNLPDDTVETKLLR